MRVVRDTNVLLSAAWRNRLPEQVVLHVASHSECEWIVTDSILSEYVSVLRRPKFQLSSELIASWTELVNMRTVLVSLPKLDTPTLRDPADEVFLAAAIACQADYLITGDKDLLDAKLSIPTRIVTVADFAAIQNLSQES